MKRLNRNVELAVIAINQQIDMLITYGLRWQPIRTHGYRIAWSNNDARWWRYYNAVHSDKAVPIGQRTVSLDANELLIVGHTKPTIEKALPLLKQHPLYEFSYEVMNRDYMGQGIAPRPGVIRMTDQYHRKD